MKISDEYGPGTIHCAGCGGGMTQLLETIIAARPREDGPVSVTVVRADGSVELNSTRFAGGWSQRRDSAALRLDCEQCPAITLHTFSQHKGNTYLKTFVESESER